MKGQALHITFHNPNDERDSEKLAKDFVSQLAFEVFSQVILDYQKRHNKTNSSESKCDLD